MNKEIESTLMAGSLVHFVYLDPNGDRIKNSEFETRCHFIPRIVDRLEIDKGKLAFVKKIYHSFVQSNRFEKGVFFQVVTVALSSQPDLQNSAPLRQQDDVSEKNLCTSLQIISY